MCVGRCIWCIWCFCAGTDSQGEYICVGGIWLGVCVVFVSVCPCTHGSIAAWCHQMQYFKAKWQSSLLHISFRNTFQPFPTVPKNNILYKLFHVDSSVYCIYESSNQKALTVMSWKTRPHLKLCLSQRYQTMHYHSRISSSNNMSPFKTWKLKTSLKTAQVISITEYYINRCSLWCLSSCQLEQQQYLS